MGFSSSDLSTSSVSCTTPGAGHKSHEHGGHTVPSMQELRGRILQDTASPAREEQAFIVETRS